MRAKIILLIITLLNVLNGTAQYLLSSFPLEKDLSSRQITCFFQDHRGFMWIGTEDGLNLYNGNSIKIYKHDVKDKNSLGNNYVQNICEDPRGNIWIGTANGVDMMDASDNFFLHYTADDRNEPFAFKNRIYSDRTGNIWMCNNGLFKYDPAKKQFHKIVNTFPDARFGGRLENIINGLFQDSQLHYWVSTNDGLFLYDDIKKIFSRVDVPPNDENARKNGILFSNVYEDKNGNLFAGTWGYGLYKIDAFQQKLTPLFRNGVILTYTSQQVNGREILWCPQSGLSGIENGIPLPANNQGNNDPFSARSINIHVLYTDRQGQLWIGYETEGIQILNPGNQLIRTVRLSKETDATRINSVGVIRKKNNSIYIGGWYGDAMCRIDTGFTEKKWWHTLPPGISDGNNISDIYNAPNGDLWFATFAGLVCMNKNEKFTVYKYDTAVNRNNRFLRILPVTDSVLWLAGYKNGLTRFSLRDHHMESTGTDPIYRNLATDGRGNIWCANNNGTLDKYDIENRKFTKYNFDSLTEKSILYDVLYDSNSNSLWVTNRNGLLKVDAATLKARLFTEKDGLPTSNVSLLAMDSHHHLWIGTSRGLSMYTPQTNSFLNFYSNNGLATEDIQHSLSVEPDGKLYIGGENNFMVMDIQRINYKPEPSPVYITSVTAIDKLLEPSGGRKIELGYDQNSLTFEFAIADLINSEDNQLFYKLENWDKEFIRTKKGEAKYYQLPPGKYIFRVKGINHAGVRNDTGDMIELVIHPPFWRTWWFITLLSVVLISLLVTGVKYISQRNLKERILRIEKEQAVERERNRISRDMHDDLGSGLTKIAIMSEVVKRQINEPEKARQQLENISESSRELVDNLQDIIWVLNPKNDTLENLASYIREYALKFFETFGIDLTFNYPPKFPDVRLSEETRRNIFLTVKETFTNTAKHAWCNKVSITIEAGNKITIIIQDDGKGFDVEKTRQFGNGLLNMKNRIMQVNGSFDIISGAGKGTTTMITIPV